MFNTLHLFKGPVVGYISDNYGWGAMLALMNVLSTLSSITMFRAMVVQRRMDRSGGQIPYHLHHGSKSLSSSSEDKVPLMN